MAPIPPMVLFGRSVGSVLSVDRQRAQEPQRHPEVTAASGAPLPDAPAARPSLLWPGQARRRLERWDWWLLGAAYLLAVAVRWAIRDAGPYTAEAAHYALSRHLWQGVDNVASLFPDVRPDDFSWFFWQRPLLCLLYWPAAQGGFAVYRAAHILVAGTVPGPAAMLLPPRGARPPAPAGA